VHDPSGSPASPIDAKGITEKFRGINPQLPADAIAGMALDIERHSMRKFLALLALENKTTGDGRRESAAPATHGIT